MKNRRIPEVLCTINLLCKKINKIIASVIMMGKCRMLIK